MFKQLILNFIAILAFINSIYLYIKYKEQDKVLLALTKIVRETSNIDRILIDNIRAVDKRIDIIEVKLYK